jgi:hypothetical protein
VHGTPSRGRADCRVEYRRLALNSCNTSTCFAVDPACKPNRDRSPSDLLRSLVGLRSRRTLPSGWYEVMSRHRGRLRSRPGTRRGAALLSGRGLFRRGCRRPRRQHSLGDRARQYGCARSRWAPAGPRRATGGGELQRRIGAGAARHPGDQGEAGVRRRPGRRK